MKLSTPVDILTSEEISVTSQVIVQSYIGHILQGFARVCAWLSAPVFAGGRLLRRALRFSIVSHYGFDRYYERELYEKTGQRHIPYHIWQRHSALLYQSDRDVLTHDKYSADEHSYTNGVARAQNSCHISVNQIISLPVWSTNLDDIRHTLRPD